MIRCGHILSSNWTHAPLFNEAIFETWLKNNEISYLILLHSSSDSNCLPYHRLCRNRYLLYYFCWRSVVAGKRDGDTTTVVHQSCPITVSDFDVIAPASASAACLNIKMCEFQFQKLSTLYLNSFCFPQILRVDNLNIQVGDVI